MADKLANLESLVADLHWVSVGQWQQHGMMTANSETADVHYGAGQVGSALCPSGFGSGVQFAPAQFLGAPAYAYEAKSEKESPEASSAETKQLRPVHNVAKLLRTRQALGGGLNMWRCIADWAPLGAQDAESMKSSESHKKFHKDEEEHLPGDLVCDEMEQPRGPSSAASLAEEEPGWNFMEQQLVACLEGVREMFGNCVLPVDRRGKILDELAESGMATIQASVTSSAGRVELYQNFHHLHHTLRHRIASMLR